MNKSEYAQMLIEQARAQGKRILVIGRRFGKTWSARQECKRLMGPVTDADFTAHTEQCAQDICRVFKIPAQLIIELKDRDE